MLYTACAAFFNGVAGWQAVVIISIIIILAGFCQLRESRRKARMVKEIVDDIHRRRRGD